MFEKIVFKKLSENDLAFFKFRSPSLVKTKAKGISLNQSVLEKIYPSLPTILEKKQRTIMMTLNINGPGLTPEYTIQRRIQENGSYKNYYLNGEFIPDPEEDSDRFHSLQSGDFVILDFVGDLEPVSARAVFVAQSLKVDKNLHAALDKFIGSESMVAVSASDLEQIISGLSLPN